MGKDVLLIGFYNEKALGVRYLANALNTGGYNAHILYFKEFNSVNPSKAGEKELDLLEDLINKIKPSYIGLSVMSSLYLESVYLVNNRIREKFDIPIIWGGVYTTLFPEEVLKYGDYAIRGESEIPLVELLDTLERGEDPFDIENITLYNRQGEIIRNPLRPLVQDLDTLGYPKIGGKNIYFIHNNEMSYGDPQVKGFTYELTASRGCPFACSYCSSVNLRRTYVGGGKYVRFRSVDSVMEELKEAKSAIKNLKVIHFWDEIFSDEEGWVEEFKERYKSEIGIPFKIWGHPLKTSERIISNLVDAGLYQIVVGIQSGSVRVRKDIFHRRETQEEIIDASRVLSKCKVPKVIYDFMLQHPFETLEDLKETYRLCLKLEPPFELQLHGLNFLPGTDIVDKAIDAGLLSKEELDKIMYSSIQDQYDMYWGPAAVNQLNEDSTWIALIYLTQFPGLRSKVEKLAKEAEKGSETGTAIRLQKFMKQVTRFRSLMGKAKLVISGG